ncbi:MAG: Hsp70 family protein [Chloroflexi bacterium]|nr:Hsp70 family protein [Chloroflexota bacterium]
MIVGMDFGTTNSGMAWHDGERLRLVPLDPANENPATSRSALYITNRKEVYVGREAVETYYAQNINRKVKYQRVWVGEIELSYAELPDWVRDLTVEIDVLAPGRLFLSFKTGLKSPTYSGTTVGQHFYFLEDIVALYLYITRRRAEAFLGHDVDSVVLGRPVHFSLDPQQDGLAEQRLVHAAIRAGYEHVYLQYEPIAAASYYESTLEREEHVLVFDFGGGTLDVSVARLGDPRTRAILSNGGIPVAGDIFDQKLVQAKLPSHFGEGGYYTSDTGSRLPVPANFYTAFSDWQEMLELNKPDMLAILQRIAENAERPRPIRALIDLISSSYSLKMVDAVEVAKRELSGLDNALINLDGPGFRVRQLVTRAEFERLIDEDVQAVSALLDEVIGAAGLADADIDAVIRTGGSSQIPAFIELLERRFGPENVRPIDTFSSVTSGLGILARDLARDAIELRGYHAADWTFGSQMRQGGRQGIPPVDLGVMKKYIDLQHSQPPEAASVGIVTLTTDNEVAVALPERGQLRRNGALSLDEVGGEAGAMIGIGELPVGATHAAPADAPLVLMTSEYRFLLRTLHELADLRALGLNLAEAESFYEDQFGQEFVCALQTWSDLAGADRLMFISTLGKGKVMPAEGLLADIQQPHPFRAEALDGYPAALVPANDGSEVVIITDGGSVVRLRPDDVPRGIQRVISLGKSERVLGAFNAAHPVEFLLMTDKGLARRVHARSIRRSASGKSAKILPRRTICAFAPLHSDVHLWAITTQRLLPIDLAAIPPDDDLHPLLRLHRDEHLLALHDLS